MFDADGVSPTATVPLSYVVIAVVRDEEDLIPRTIASTIAQTRLSEAWIVVDDGSRDRTAEILATAGVVANQPGGVTHLVLPTKLIEYQSMGIPAVVSRTETIDHYFEPDKLITVPRPGPDAFARALPPLIKDNGA